MNIYEAKTHLSQLIDRVTQGEEVIIARNGRAVARLVPVGRRAQRPEPGSMRGLIWISDDFDDPMPDLEALFYGEEEGR